MKVFLVLYGGCLLDVLKVYISRLKFNVSTIAILEINFVVQGHTLMYIHICIINYTRRSKCTDVRKLENSLRYCYILNKIVGRQALIVIKSL